MERKRTAEGESGAAVLAEWREKLSDRADTILDHLRMNLRTTMEATGLDAQMIYAMTGVSPNTVRGFLNGSDSGIRNVVLICGASGIPLAEMMQPAADFADLLRARLEARNP